MGKHGSESPWLPLPVERRQRLAGVRRWLRSNAAIVIGGASALAAAATAIVALINVSITDSRFRSEHRPWLIVRISKDTIEWREGLYEAVPIVRNVGAGPAIWFYGAGVRFDTREPVALPLGIERKARPTRILPPGDSTYLRSALIPVDTSPREERPFYYHHVIWYGGTARQETLYYEQVFFVDPRPNLHGKRDKLLSGEECAYIGRVRAGRVILEGTVTPDYARRESACKALDEMVQRRAPALDVKGTRISGDDTIAVLRSYLQTLRDSASWIVYVESLRSDGFLDEDIDCARAALERLWRTFIESLNSHRFPRNLGTQ